MQIPSIIAPLMRKRVVAISIAIFPVIFMLLNVLELFIWKCPFNEYLGIHCFGCGMTRAVLALGKGEFIEALNLHPFSFLLILGWILWTTISLIPGEKRIFIANKVEILENKTGFPFIIILFFICFGLARLIFQIYDYL